MAQLLNAFDLPLQFYIIDQNNNFDEVQRYCFNLSSTHGRLIDPAPQGDGILFVDLVLDCILKLLTEYTNMCNHSCLQTLVTPGYASRYNAEKQMLWHCCLLYVRLKASETVPTVIAHTLRMTSTW